MLFKNFTNIEHMTDAIERNFSDFFIEMAKLKGCEYNIGQKYKWVKGNDKNWPSGIFDIRLDVDSIDEIVKDMAKRMESGLLPRTIMTGPSSVPNNYDTYFNKFGIVRKYEAVGMAINLTEIDLKVESINNLKISILDEEELLLNWCEIVCVELFRKSSSGFIEDFYNTIKLALTRENFKCFVAKEKGEIVATSFLYLNNDIAGVYFVATQKEYRNKGIGKLITKAPLVYAKELGYSIATLQASPLGEIIYKKIGFKEFCRLGRYQLN